ncbi:unnamed protein product [Gordionus sp. m RMFG-2023]|uniref:solute carrier family 25 member 32-like n=1 Tax=Gordionus sp. m RMFG-2023 TaxID=3053472 RepID=UPI0030E11F3F
MVYSVNLKEKKVNYDHLIAGVAGGVVSAFILHPFDLLKLRFAANDGLTNTIPTYHGVLDAFRRIYKYEGNIFGLYRGVTPNIIGSGTAWGLYFFIYNVLKSWMNEGKSTTSLTPLQSTCAAATSGLTTLLLTNPIWLVKTRLCLQTNDPSVTIHKFKIYRGTWDALTSIYKYEGTKGLYKGFVPGLFGVSHGTLQFMAYEELKKRYYIYKHLPKEKKLNNHEYLTMAALSKIFAVNLTYPFQVIKFRLQDRNKDYGGFRDAVVKIMKHEGILGFYKGWIPQILRVTPATCITFLVYENLIQYLSEL